MATLTMAAPSGFSSNNTLANPRTTVQTLPASIPPKIRPYKDFLTPALHRRFTTAALLVFIACYLESAWLSDAGLLWRCFPVSLTGIRALLLFVPCLSVFIVRVANLHLGRKMTISGIETGYQLAKSFGLWHTLAWYTFSAWLFGEVYIWSSAENAHLEMVDLGREDERPRLNENPVQLRCHLLWLALCMTSVHFYKEYDRVELAKGSSNTEHPILARLPRPLRLLLEQLRTNLLGQTIPFVFLTACFGLPVYFGLMRNTAWSYTYSIGRTVFSELPRQAERASGITHGGTQILTVLGASTQLVLLWQVSNVAFSICVAEPPLKKGQPLTSEIKDPQGNVVSRSLNPNASLLNGLNSKKEVVRTFAFWELLTICSQFEARRRTIFMEGEKKEDCTWTKICSCCLAEIESIKQRIHHSLDVPIDQQREQDRADQLRKQQQEQIARSQNASFGMPKILGPDQTARDNPDVFQRAHSTGLVQIAGNVAKSFGNSPGAQNPVTPRARKMLEYGADRMLTKEQQAQLTPAVLSKEAGGLVLQILRTPVGIPFRQSFARRLLAVLFGVPYSTKLTIIHAARSLTALAVSSLAEDIYGRVATDVPKILRSFTSTIQEINKFTVTLEPSWTDVEFDPRRDRAVAEAIELTGVLRQCLEEILLKFGEFAPAIGLSQREVREMKDVAGRGGNEMVQVR